MTERPQFKVGDRVRYTEWSGVAHTATVVGLGEKNGELVYDVDLENGQQRWGYADQVTAL